MLCGIDEAGRGPLAGPLCVAGAIFVNEVKELNDSKKLSEKKKRRIIWENKRKLSLSYSI